MGWLTAVPLVRALGPSPLLGPGRIAQAQDFAVLAAAVALLALALATTVVAARAQRVRPPGVGPTTAVAWELIVLALAMAAGYQVLVRGPAAGGVDLLAVAFPLLGVAAVVGLAVRGLGRLLPRLARERSGGNASAGAPWWLAVRRVAGQRRQGLALVTLAGVALGLLIYAAALTTSTGPAVAAKVDALAGAEARAEVSPTWALQEGGGFLDLPADMSMVWRESETMAPWNLRVRVLAVDTTNYAAAALWRETFADDDLATLFERLRGTVSDGVGGSAVPVLAVAQGDERVPNIGTIGGDFSPSVPLRVVGRPKAFAGMTELRPTLVVDARVLFPRLGGEDPTLPPPQGAEDPSYTAELWAAEGADQLTSFLAGRGESVEEIATRAQVAARPELLVQTWSLGYLLALGVGIGLLAAAALLGYAEQRRAAREVAYALARRMGLSRAANAAAAGLELIGLLTLSLLLGTATGLAAARLVVARLDPLPTIRRARGSCSRCPASWRSPASWSWSARSPRSCSSGAPDRADVAEVLRVAE